MPADSPDLCTDARLEAAGRTAEFHRTPTGVVLRLGLADGGEPTGEPFLECPLAELLTWSTGRPWRLSDVRAVPRSGDESGWWLARPDSSAPSTRIRAGCRVGDLAVELAFGFEPGALLAVEASWRNVGRAELTDLAVGLVVPPHLTATGEPEAPGVPDVPDVPDVNVTLPGLIYHDNPSADPDRPVPRVGTRDGGGFVAEEDRLPIPGVNLDWTVGGQPRYLSVLTRPEARRTPNGGVRYGSLGVVRRGQTPVVVALSGPVMFAGTPDVRYVSKAETAPAADGYLTLQPGQTVHRRVLLDWGTLERRGHGFRRLVHTGRSVCTAPGARPLTLDEIIACKAVAMDHRWHADGEVAGYTKFSEIVRNGPDKPAYFLYGWTGQALKLAWCDARLGLEGTEGADRGRLDRARAAVDFYLRGSTTRTPGLRANSYQLAGRRWEGFRYAGGPMVSSRAYGETVADLAELVLLLREHGEPVPAEWQGALDEVVGFWRSALLPNGTFPVGWRFDGTPVTSLLSAAGIPCVLATAKVARALNAPELTDLAADWLSRYHDQHADTFDRPFAHSTLDAACEDKEAGMYYFLAAYELFRSTGAARFADWAAVAADWLLTFVYVWSPLLDDTAPLTRAGFNAVGWPTVSVQNHHPDAFFPSFELVAFGAETGCREYVRAGNTAMYAMGQGICTSPGEWDFPVVGEQGEAFFQTYWQARGSANTWNPSWVIALVLSNALRLRTWKAAP